MRTKDTKRILKEIEEKITDHPDEEDFMVKITTEGNITFYEDPHMLWIPENSSILRLNGPVYIDIQKISAITLNMR